jgi:hypothetical protein
MSGNKNENKNIAFTLSFFFHGHSRRGQVFFCVMFVGFFSVGRRICDGF